MLTSSAPRYDVAVIGAGVVGAAIARRSRPIGSTSLLLEAGDDVGAGTEQGQYRHPAHRLRHQAGDARVASGATRLRVALGVLGRSLASRSSASARS